MPVIPASPLPAAPEDPSPTPRQQRILWTALTMFAVTVLLGLAAILFLAFTSFLAWSYPLLLPIGLAVIVALMLEPIVEFVQRRGVPRRTATLLVCLLTVIGFVIFLAFLLPPLVKESIRFFDSLPALLNTGAAKLQDTLEHPPKFTKSRHPPAASRAVVAAPPVTPADPAAATASPAGASGPAGASPAPPPGNPGAGTVHSEIQQWIGSNLPALEDGVQKNVAHVAYSALGPVGQALGFLLGFGFVPIYVYYFLADQERIAAHWHEYVPLRRSRLRDEVVSVLAEINTSLVSYFRGQIIVASWNGLLTLIGLTIIGIPYSLVLGVITGALSIVPFLGIIASIIPAVLLGFVSAQGDPTGQWLRPVLVLVVFAIVQMTESMFITPRVQSHSTGLHPLAIIIGILFWSMLLPGLLGPVVAVPLTCAAVVLMRRYIWQQAPKPPRPAPVAS